ncbi:hypothetical protein SERLA73DRAFT_188803 [Serpula lacrymans var. lacrymans S7.3]|uniref:Uncharacterized protein n=2 Tax=Serpula lacrymans var. lacrymans TaxID=341189 RepID=F8QC71_SERL3|nr:uncharacterized protein SERLADRAFT_479231 [Serpula lacrymans var. lacrymans S7.9]EGN94190.1 hypothetical protein SERLA73DRAFT_188803 [Serpula lacrymans var. lacrymans S7.3]EGO19615.1 hypothetical protein SERLADRAFT_479231 [Serpula lacrymans var. lacrymans S7.9]
MMSESATLPVMAGSSASVGKRSGGCVSELGNEGRRCTPGLGDKYGRWASEGGKSGRCASVGGKDGRERLGESVPDTGFEVRCSIEGDIGGGAAARDTTDGSCTKGVLRKGTTAGDGIENVGVGVRIGTAAGDGIENVGVGVRRGTAAGDGIENAGVLAVNDCCDCCCDPPPLPPPPDICRTVSLGAS